jgi:hypothetical protein
LRVSFLIFNGFPVVTVLETVESCFPALNYFENASTATIKLIGGPKTDFKAFWSQLTTEAYY